MKQIKTILALLLCLCMLPFSALAAAADDGTLDMTTYTPEESGLYAVTVQRDGKPLDPLPAKEAIYEPALSVSVTAGDAAAQEVDYNVFWLMKGTEYSVQLQKTDEAFDAGGEWALSVEKVEVKPLTLDADALTEGAWFSFTPAEDGSYTITAAPEPVFVEVMTEGAVSGDWAGYALDKEKCRVGMELDYLRSLKAAIALRAEELDLAEDAYNKALNKLDNYNSMIDLADKTGIGGEGSNLFNKKQAVYDALKEALLRGDETFQFDIPIIGNILPKINLPTIDREVIENLPANVEELPDYLSEKLASSEGLVGEAKAKYEDLKAEQDADQARYDAGLAANPQLADLIDNTSAETATLRQQVQNDADAIMGSASALAVSNGMTLVAAEWQNQDEDSPSVTLTKGTTYIIHALSNLETSATVTDGTETPPEQTVDKTALEAAIAAAEKINPEEYTADSAATLSEALAAAKAVLDNENADQTAVDNARKALEDAVKGLQKEDPEQDDSLLKKALRALIEEVDKLPLDKYTDESAAAFKDALDNAKEVLNDPDATLSDIVDATKALREAYEALEEKPEEHDTVNKAELEKAIQAAEAVDTSKYTDDSVSAMQQALKAAKDVNGKADVTQAEVDAAANTLNEAVAALKPVTTPTPTVDKTALQSAIAAAKAVDKTKYTDASVAAMTKALSDAEAVNSNADATQADVDAAAQALNDAVKALKEKPVTPPVQGADKTELKKAIQAAEAIDRSKYTDDSVDQLDRILSYAKSVDADKDASQARVTNAAALLNNAIDDLKEKSADPQQPDKCDGGANCPSKIFKDVNQKKWYHEAIDYAIVNKLFNGTSPNTFEPDTAMTRGMLVTVLYRMENEPGAKTTPAFTDLRQNWYKTAVAWAAENKIVNGIDATHFAPDAKVTREQAMTMLMRYAQFKGYDTSAREDLSAFKDAASVRSWALDAMQWGVSVGLIQGVGGGMLDPRGDSSRAQVATILMRFRENIAK